MGRLLVEALAIVASILAAFAIDAWWDGRQNLAEEVELLVGLTEEFEENARRIDEMVDRSERGRANLQRFLASTPDEIADLALELSMYSTYEPLIRTWSMAPAAGFLQATINSGKLALIRDAELRAALARFEGLQSNVSEVLGHTNELDRAAATELGSFDEVRAVVSGLENFSQEDLSEVRLSAATLSAMRSDRELVSIATAKLRYWDAYLYEVGLLRDNVTAVLALIERNRAG